MLFVSVVVSMETLGVFTFGATYILYLSLALLSDIWQQELIRFRQFAVAKHISCSTPYQKPSSLHEAPHCYLFHTLTECCMTQLSHQTSVRWGADPRLEFQCFSRLLDYVASLIGLTGIHSGTYQKFAVI